MKIEGIIRKGETESIEFKESLSLHKEIVETVSAFSNTNGGIILVGVSNKKEILGMKLGKRTLEELANKIRQNTDPPVFPAIWTDEIDGRHIIAIEVKESATKPTLAFGRAFKRVGKANHRLTFDEIRTLSIESKKVYWDEQICEGAEIGDIDKELVIEFLKRAKYERNLDIEPNIGIEEALRRLKLLRGKELINAGILIREGTARYISPNRNKMCKVQRNRYYFFYRYEDIQRECMEPGGRCRKFCLKTYKLVCLGGTG
jgi:ATP-dependent DNA helicase RecG